jgi:two-component system chemotaxis sensor kinase CheA
MAVLASLEQAKHGDPLTSLEGAAIQSVHVEAERTARGEPAVVAHPATAGATPNVSGIGDSGSIRVSVEKIDELMNTVGELVITQAMLSQLGRGLEGPSADQFRSGLAQLERNMRELQESVMRVRMLPIRK